MARESDLRPPDNSVSLLHEYDAQERLHGDLCLRVSTLLGELLAEQQGRVHSISSRVKERSSLERKLRQRPDKYRSLGDVTDIVGARIITYFSDEVDAVARLITNEFEVDVENSLDKRATLEPDQFGYLSLHYIVRIKPERRALIEYRRFHNCWFEVQIRSILQHAWAEIEHDLGYKSEGAVPRHIRRRFSRLAGLLEVADEEFSGLRQELESYGATVTERVETSPGEVFIDRESLEAFLHKSSILARIDDAISEKSGVELQRDWIEDDTRSAREADQLSGRLQAAGFRTIGQVEEELSRNETVLIELASRVLTVDTLGGIITPGIGLFHLANLYVLQSADALGINRYLTNVGTETEDWPQTLGKIYQEVARIKD